MKSFPRRAGAPAAAPLSLEVAKAHLRVTDGAEDAYIAALIDVVREACENRIERTLISTQWTLTLDSFPDAIELLMPPVVSVTSVAFVDPDATPQVLNPGDYVLDRAREPGWLVPAPGRRWPSTEHGINKVVVSYTAGYGVSASDVPAPLRHWMLLALTELFETRSASAERPVVRNEFVDHLLAPYRVWGL